MSETAYSTRRDELETYFDRTAAEAWSRLTTDAPVSKIRQTVRAGRDRMRAQLLSWLPQDLSGRRILDAGCGTGAFAVELAQRGADVVAVDVARSLIDVAEERSPTDLKSRLTFVVGDMLSAEHGTFDHVVAMDSLIHYEPAQITAALGLLAQRTNHSMVFTFAPATPALRLMHAVGRSFPRSDRAPAIVPVNHGNLARKVDDHPALSTWAMARDGRIKAGFYISHGQELSRA
jgi:magnesium-protoporphyrin O-methyltransferase